MTPLSAAQAKRISDLARKHKGEMLDLQERHFTEMHALLDSMQTLLASMNPTTLPVFTVEDKKGDKFEVHGLLETYKYVSGAEVHRLNFLGTGAGCGYIDTKGRIWRRKA